jgi:transcription-repair coupling factor (superfamily II helicase)
MRDLDLRGAGDLTGDEQAGHVKKIGAGLYQKLLLDAVRDRRDETAQTGEIDVELGFTGYLPSDYVPDAMVRLSLYTRLLRTTDTLAVDDLQEEMTDRFGTPNDAVLHLLRITKLKLAAARIGISKLSAGPLALAVTFIDKKSRSIAASCPIMAQAQWKDDRAIFQTAVDGEDGRLAFFETLLAQFSAATSAAKIKPAAAGTIGKSKG